MIEFTIQGTFVKFNENKEYYDYFGVSSIEAHVSLIRNDVESLKFEFTKFYKEGFAKDVELLYIGVVNIDEKLLRGTWGKITHPEINGNFELDLGHKRIVFRLTESNIKV